MSYAIIEVALSFFAAVGFLYLLRDAVGFFTRKRRVASLTLTVPCTGDDAKAGVRKLSEQMAEIGYEVVSDRGDFKKL